MPQQTFSNLDTRATVRGKLNANANDAESRLVAIESGSRFIRVDGTNADVSMLANRRYVIDGSILTANRIYFLPAGTVGDEIDVLMTAGNTNFALVISGTTGVAVNGGPTATEWSRLFMAGEYLRFYCDAQNSWWVTVDGRIGSRAKMTAGVNFSISAGVYNRNRFTVTNFDRGGLANLSADQFTVRRDGNYRLSANMGFANSGAVEYKATYNVGGTRFERIIQMSGSATTYEHTFFPMPTEVFAMSAGGIAYSEICPGISRTSIANYNWLQIEEVF